MEPKRRQLLLAAAGGFALSGCFGDSDDDGDDTDGTEDADDGDGSEDTMDDDGSTDDGTGDDDGMDGSEADVTITLQGSSFNPDLVTIDPGDTVLWRQESGNHSVTTYHPDNGMPERVPADVAIDTQMGSGDELEQTFEEPGVYDYFCRPHHSMGMVGSVVAGEPSADEPGLAPAQNDLPDGAATAISDLNERVRQEFGLEEGGADATVTVSEHPDHGAILTGPDGHSLYMFDADEQGSGESACYDGCAENWPPLTVEDAPVAGEGVEAELGTIEREDGSMQVTANGWPLYYFVNDEGPGDVAGQGANDVWWLLTPAGEPIRGGDATVQVAEHPDHGAILTGSDGLSLYMFDADEQGSGESACYDGCAENWPPLTVEEEPVSGEGVEAELGTIEREDGSMQVTANGWPLYYFVNDEGPGDVTGQGANDVWWLLDPSGEPIRGREPTVQVREDDEHGDILVGSDGMTLYMFDADEQGAGESACQNGCAENWPPLTAEDPVAGEAVTADLSTFERQDGSVQVAANGWPLYYWINDEEPGDVDGQGVNDVWWVITPAGEPVRE